MTKFKTDRPVFFPPMTPGQQDAIVRFSRAFHVPLPTLAAVFDIAETEMDELHEEEYGRIIFECIRAVRKILIPKPRDTYVPPTTPTKRPTPKKKAAPKKRPNVNQSTTQDETPPRKPTKSKRVKQPSDRKR